MVQGKYIDISATSINDFFKLSNEVHYAKLQTFIETDNLLHVICNSLKPEWSGGHLKALKSTSLSREAKV